MGLLANMGHLKDKDHHVHMDHLKDKDHHVDMDHLTYMNPLMDESRHVDTDHLICVDPLGVKDLLVGIHHLANADHLAGIHHLQVDTDHHLLHHHLPATVISMTAVDLIPLKIVLYPLIMMKIHKTSKT
ncbi:uncharacterized protein LOC134741397 isoform X2 [Cydia strobilella]|uniref:uncharacterized protein LOC134741397 isoform X2 n=1 Tax=Cydia strobilella TaxID=1100964 RepID=UPI0030072EA1